MAERRLEKSALKFGTMMIDNCPSLNPTGLPHAVFLRLEAISSLALKGSVTVKERRRHYGQAKEKYVEHQSSFQITLDSASQTLQCTFGGTPHLVPRAAFCNGQDSYGFTLSKFNLASYNPYPAYGNIIADLANLLWNEQIDRERLLEQIKVVGEEEIEGLPCYKISYGLPRTDSNYIWLDRDTLAPVRIRAKTLKTNQAYQNSFSSTLLEMPPLSWLVFWLLIVHDTILSFSDRRDLVLLRAGYDNLDVEYSISEALLNNAQSISNCTKT